MALKKSPERAATIKMILSYLSVLIIPLMLSVVIYYSAVISITDLVKDYSKTVLNQAAGVMDIRLRELEAVPFYIKSNSDIIRLAGQDNITSGSPEMYDVYSAYTNMPKFSLINSMVDELQVIMLENEFVIGENGALRLNSATYTALFPYTGLSYDKFEKWITDNFFNNKFVQFTSEKSIKTPVFISSIDYNYSGKPVGAVMIKLKLSAIEDLLADMCVGSQGMAFVLDEDGRLIASSGADRCQLPIEDAITLINEDEKTYKDYGNYVISTITSEYNSWRYCVVATQSEMLAQVKTVQNTILLLACLAIVLSLIFALLLGRHKASSLRMVVRYLTGIAQGYESRRNDEYGYIASAANSLVTNNKRMEELLRRQQPLLDAAHLRNLLTGDLHKPDEISQLFEMMSILPQNQKYAVLLCAAQPVSSDTRAAEYKEYPAFISAVITKHLENSFSCKVFCLDMDITQKAVVLVADSIDTLEFIEIINSASKSAYENALNQSGLSLVFYAGDIQDTIDGVHRAYRQAFAVSQQAFTSPERYLYSQEDIPAIQKLYAYPIKTELSLITNIKRGETSEVELIFETIRSENFQKRSLSNSMLCQLVSAIKGSILRGMGDLSEQPIQPAPIAELTQAVSFDDLYTGALKLCASMSGISTRNVRESQEQEKQLILTYIQEHYTENDFSIYKICDSFNMSESTAYQFFREIVGASFADMVESMRIEKACAMLREEKCTVKTVAEQVGYTSDNSFRRAFKRVMGVPPSDYTICQ